MQLQSAGDVDYQIVMCSSMNDSSNSSSDFFSGDGSGFMNSMPGSGMTAVALCLNITIIGDDTVEDMEYINITFTSDDQASFVGPSQAQVHIVDDDGELSNKQTTRQPCMQCTATVDSGA